MIKKYGFTLAEVLITIVVIGVVSALVIPSVIKNYNDKKYNTARLKALKTFGEAGKMASINGEINGQPTAKDFVNNVLSKYLKIVKVCDTAQECGFPEKIQPLDLSETKLISNNIKAWKHLGSASTQNNLTPLSNTSLSTYITTVDGFSAKLFYNPNCIKNYHDNPVGTCRTKECVNYSVDIACINMIYDMNGTKPPNHIGKDMGFVTVYWSGLNVTAVAPGIIDYILANNLSNEGGSKTSQESSSFCANNGLSLPNVDELSSLVINHKLSSKPHGFFWSSSTVPSRTNMGWVVGGNGSSGNRTPVNFNTDYKIWCTRR